MKALKNLKDTFLEKWSDIEQNLERNLKKKEYEKLRDFQVSWGGKNLKKDEPWSKDKFINILLESFKMLYQKRKIT